MNIKKLSLNGSRSNEPKLRNKYCLISGAKEKNKLYIVTKTPHGWGTRRLGRPEFSRFVLFSVAQNFALFSSFWGVLEESWPQHKAMDHSKCAFRLLLGHLVRAPAASSRNFGILFLPLGAMVFFRIVINIGIVLFQLFFHLSLTSGYAPTHNFFGGSLLQTLPFGRMSTCTRYRLLTCRASFVPISHPSAFLHWTAAFSNTLTSLGTVESLFSLIVDVVVFPFLHHFSIFSSTQFKPPSAGDPFFLRLLQAPLLV